MKKVLMRLIFSATLLIFGFNSAFAAESELSKHFEITKQKLPVEITEIQTSGIVEIKVTLKNISGDTFIIKEGSINGQLQPIEVYDESRYSYFKRITAPRKYKSTYSPINKHIKEFVKSFEGQWTNYVITPGETSELRVFLKAYYEPKLSLEMKSKTTGQVYFYED